MRWSSLLPTGFLVSCGTPDTRPLHWVSPTGLSPCLVYLSRYFNYSISAFRRSSTPYISLHKVWAPPLSLTTTKGIDSFFLFLRLMRCFSSPSSPRYTMYSCIDTASSTRWVSSFGNLRIIVYVQLPEAYRSLSRPSSAPSAKAFTLHP